MWLFCVIYAAIIAAKFTAFCASLAVRLIERYRQKQQQLFEDWKKNKSRKDIFFSPPTPNDLDELNRQRKSFKYWRQSKIKMF